MLRIGTRELRAEEKKVCSVGKMFVSIGAHQMGISEEILEVLRLGYDFVLCPGVQRCC